MNPSVQGNTSQWPAALQRWVEAHDVAVHADAQVVESLVQHGVTLDRQTLPVAQSASTVQSFRGGGDMQKLPQAEETPDGSDVHTEVLGQSLIVRHCVPESGCTPGQTDPLPATPPFAPPAP